MTSLALSRVTGRPVAATSALAIPGTTLAPVGTALTAAAKPAMVSVAEPPAGLGPMLRPAAFGRWILPQLANITPTYIEGILRGAFGGSHIEQWQLFDLMEDTWPRLLKNLNEIKRAVVAMDWANNLHPWAEEDKPPTDTAKERARVVSNALWRMRPDPCCDENGFPATIYDLLDAWGKGISVVEVIWEIRHAGALGPITAPRATVWVRPDNYAWSSTENRLGLNPAALEQQGDTRMTDYGGHGEPGRTGRRPRSYAYGSGPSNPAFYSRPEEVLDFPPDKFLIGISKAKTGHPIGGALLRGLAWWWCAANFSADWLMNLAQIFGLPFRWANYASGTDAATIAKICSMLQNMGSEAWGCFPEGTTIDFKEASKSGDQSPQADLIERADKNCDLLLLGQTLTSDTGGMGQGGGSLALGKVHAGVKGEVIQSAGNFVAEVLNCQLIPSILRVNYGDEEEPPELRPKPSEQKDQQANATRDATLLAAGVKLPKNWFYKRHDVPLPQEGEEVIESKPEPEAPGVRPSPAARPPEASDDPADPPDEDEEPDDPAMSARAALRTNAPADLPSDLKTFQQRHLAEAAASDLAFIAQRGNALLADLKDPNYDDATKRAKLADYHAWLEKVKPTLLRNPQLAEALEETTAQSLANALAETSRT